MVTPKDCCGKSHTTIGWIPLKEQQAFLSGKREIRWRSTADISLEFHPSWFTCGNDEVNTLSICKDCAIKAGLLW